MADNKAQTITSRQARAQIDHFGRSLILYILITMFLQYGADYLHKIYPVLPGGLDYDYVVLLLSAVLPLADTLICFSISAAALHLPIRDYLKKPRIGAGRIFSYTCMAIGIDLIALSISTLFYFFFRTNGPTYTYLGNYNSTTTVIKNILYFAENVILIPVLNEYIFRGIIQRQLGHYGRYFGVLGSAFLYAITQPSLIQAIPSFFVGWFLSLITLRYHSIRPTISIHIGLSLFLWLLDTLPGKFLWLLTLMIVVIYIVAGLSFFQKNVNLDISRFGATSTKLWKILMTSPTIIISVALFIFNVALSYM